MKKFIWNWNRDKKFLFTLLFLRICCALTYCFLPLNNPHFQRQIDTLGVSLRYWLRFTQENIHSFTIFLPAVLNSGDGMGIMPMELPLLNILCAPFFYFGPYWGKVCAEIFVTLLATACIFLNYSIWQNKKILNENAAAAMLLFPLFSFSQAFPWRFMPDFISVTLCLMAIGLCWDRKRFFAPFILCTIGLCMKPTSAIVLALFLLHKDVVSSQKPADASLALHSVSSWPKAAIASTLTYATSPEQIFKNLQNVLNFKKYLWAILSLSVAVLYYTVVLHWVHSYADTTPFFSTFLHNPLANLYEFYTSFYSFFDLIDYHLFFPYASILFFLICLLYYLKKKNILCYSFWLLCFLQIFLIAFLDGKHAYIHYYYFIGVAPTASFIALSLWRNIFTLTPAYLRIILQITFIALFLGSYEDKAHMDIRLSSLEPNHNPVPYTDCEELIKRNPSVPWKKGVAFRTAEFTSALGLCFGVRTFSPTGKYGIYFKNESVPAGFKEIDRENNVILTVKSEEKF